MELENTFAKGSDSKIEGGICKNVKEMCAIQNHNPPKTKPPHKSWIPWTPRYNREIIMRLVIIIQESMHKDHQVDIVSFPNTDNPPSAKLVKVFKASKSDNPSLFCSSSA